MRKYILVLLALSVLSAILWKRSQSAEPSDLSVEELAQDSGALKEAELEGDALLQPDRAKPGRDAVPVDQVAEILQPATQHTGRDLTVRVFNADGQLANGVPLFLARSPFESMRGLHQDSKRTTGKERNRSPEELRGMVTWSNSSPALWPVWKDFDGGQTGASMTVGIDLPGTEHLRMELAMDDWPREAVDLHLDAAASEQVAPIRVRVLLASGEPAAGIPVGIGLQSPNPELARELGLGSGNLDSDGLPQTGPDGIAFVDRIEVLRWIRRPSPQSKGEFSQPLIKPYLFPAVPMGQRVQRSLSKGTNLDQLFELTLPQGGLVVGLVVDHLDRPIPIDPATPTLRYRLDWEQGFTIFGSPKKGDFSGVSPQNPIDLGWCGLGIKLEFSVSFVGNTYPRTEVECAGPSEDGQTTEIRVNVGQPFPQVQFQVFGLEGNPLANTPVETDRYFARALKRSHERKQHRWQSHTTDAQGRFSIAWNAVGPIAPMILCVQAQVQGEPAWATKELPPEFLEVLEPAGPNPGDQALLNGGSLTLSREPLPPLPKWEKPVVASGRLFDESGNPVKNTRVEAVPLDHHYRFAYKWTDENGFFELVKEHHVPFRLTFTSEHYEFQTTEEIPYGASGLAFTLKTKPKPLPTGQLHGKLLNIPKTIGDSLELRIDVQNLDFQVTPNRDGTFQFKRIPPGKVDVVIHCKALALEIARFKDVTIESDQNLSDSRLEDFDVGPLVRLCKFRIEFPKGVSPAGEKIPLGFDKVTRTRMRMGSRQTREVLVPSQFSTVHYGGQAFLPGQASLLGEEVHLQYRLQR